MAFDMRRTCEYGNLIAVMPHSLCLSAEYASAHCLCASALCDTAKSTLGLLGGESSNPTLSRPSHVMGTGLQRLSW